MGSSAINRTGLEPSARLTSADKLVREGQQKEKTMKRTPKKLTLNRDTVRNLSAPEMLGAAAGNVGTIRECSVYLTCVCTQSCGGTCYPAGTCFFC